MRQADRAGNVESARIGSTMALSIRDLPKKLLVHLRTVKIQNS